VRARGVSAGGLVLCIGGLCERRHARESKEDGGLTQQIPVFAVFFMIIVLSSAGLPGMNGFVGEFLVLTGTFVSGTLIGGWGQVLAIFAATGMVLGAVYLLWMFQRVMFGPLSNPKNREIKDLNAREVIYLLPIIALVFLMGVFPNVMLDDIRPSSQEFFRIFNSKLERDRVSDGEAEVSVDLSGYPHAERLALRFRTSEFESTSDDAVVTAEQSYLLRANASIQMMSASSGVVVGLALEDDVVKEAVVIPALLR